MDYLQFIFQAINNLLTQNLGFFDAMGKKTFSAHSPQSSWFGSELNRHSHLLAADTCSTSTTSQVFS
jgi:hypothetical protein